MPGIARLYVDTAGGPHIGIGAGSVYANGNPVQVLNGPVAGHGKNEHAAPFMIIGSGSVYAGGRPVCRLGDSSSCGHTSTGSPNVNAGG